jgi:hypothetical protein
MAPRDIRSNSVFCSFPPARHVHRAYAESTADTIEKATLMGGSANTSARPTLQAKVPLALKGIYSLFVAILVPVYWHHYGFADSFLWFSSMALLITAAALWLESPLLASMQLVSVFLLEMLWIADFLVRLVLGVQLVGIAAYMFSAENPLFVRGLSFFHAVLPFLLLWLVRRLGYHRRAWIVQTVFAWALLVFCFFFTDPSKNINWVFGPSPEPQSWLPPGVYLAVQMAVLLVCIYLPTHLVLQRFIPEPAKIAIDRTPDPRE